MIVDNKRVRWSYNGLYSTCQIETLTPKGVEPEVISTPLPLKDMLRTMPIVNMPGLKP